MTLYVCVHVAGHQPVECVEIMRWWIYNLRQGLLRILGSVANCYALVYFARPYHSSCLLVYFRGGIPLLPQHPHHRRVSAQDHPPTWASPVSVPEYQCLTPQPYSSLSVPPPSNPPWIPSRLTDSCCLHTLAGVEIASIATFSWSSAAFCLHHGTQSLPPLLQTLYLAHKHQK